MSVRHTSAVRVRTALGVSLAIALLGCLFGCSSASAGIVTLGSSLQGEFVRQPCGNPCTVTQTALPGRLVSAPADGAIVRWRMVGGTPETSYRLRVFDPLVGAAVFNSASGGQVSPQSDEGVESFPVVLPVRQGQQVGLDIGPLGTLGIKTTEGAAYWYTTPPPPAGASDVAQPEGDPDSEIGYNADFLPAPTVSGFSPAAGSATAPTPVTITGSNLLEVSRVDFGGTPASFQPGADSTLQVVAPPGAAGSSVPVTVVTAAGGATAHLAFSYPAAPASAPTCTVPKLSHRKLRAAKKGIRGADCKLGKVRKKKGVTAKSGRVVKQSPKPGSVVAVGTKVTLKLG